MPRHYILQQVKENERLYFCYSRMERMPDLEIDSEIHRTLMLVLKLGLGLM